jgi:hypothetical protein
MMSWAHPGTTGINRGGRGRRAHNAAEAEIAGTEHITSTKRSPLTPPKWSGRAWTTRWGHRCSRSGSRSEVPGRWDGSRRIGTCRLPLNAKAWVWGQRVEHHAQPRSWFGAADRHQILGSASRQNWRQANLTSRGRGGRLCVGRTDGGRATRLEGRWMRRMLEPSAVPDNLSGARAARDEQRYPPDRAVMPLPLTSPLASSRHRALLPLSSGSCGVCQ